MSILYICVFGVLGILSRYSLDTIFKSANQSFPYSTLIINVLGCYLIGLFYTLTNDKISPALSQGLIIGLCGGFTTFSSFSYQVLHSLESDQVFKAITYVTLSLLLGLSACYLGLKFNK